jgi:hypothetical protein
LKLGESIYEGGFIIFHLAPNRNKHCQEESMGHLRGLSISNLLVSGKPNEKEFIDI